MRTTGSEPLTISITAKERDWIVAALRSRAVAYQHDPYFWADRKEGVGMHILADRMEDL